MNVRERGIRDAFYITVALKGIDGIIEIILGVVLITTDTFTDVVFFLTRNALIEDPDNFFATHLRAFASQSHEAFVLGGLYLIAHGIVKTFLSISLWRGYIWAYPTAMVFLGLFILLQLIRISVTASVPLILLTVFDIVMFWLVWHEYKRQPQA